MKKKKVTLLALLLCSVLNGYSQADNYALRFANNGQVNCGVIDDLKASTQFTVEMWVNVDSWQDGAQIVKFGSNPENNIAVELGLESESELKVSISNGEAKVATVTNSGLKKDEWHLLTIVYKGASDEKLNVFVDAKPVAVTNASALPSTTSTQDAVFSIGNNFTGRIDEVRLWKIALGQADILLKSTVSPYHNNFSELMAYWKCDQFTSDALVDYSSNAHHGSFSNIVRREKVTDNDTFRYRPITGYLGLNAVAQGTLYDKQQLIMCNDIVLFGLSVNANTGEASFAYPDYPTILTGVDYATTFTTPKQPQGNYATNNPNDKISRVTRNAILKFKGEGAQMKIEKLDLSSKMTFETWFYVNEWKEGTALFEKKAANGDEASLKMGANDGEFIFTVSAMVGDARYTEVYPFDTYCIDADHTDVKLETKTMDEFQYWHFLSFVFNPGSDIPVSLFFDGFQQGWPKGGPKQVLISDIEKVLQNGEPMPKKTNGKLDVKVKELSKVSGDMLVGKDLNGYMDEISFWTIDRTTAQRQRTDALDAGLDLAKQGAYYTIQSLQAYYPVTEEQKTAKNVMCFENLLKIVLDHLKGYRGYKIRMTTTVNGGDWKSMMKNETIREKAAVNLAKALRESTYYKFDGLDIDFEWASTDCQEGYGLFLKKLREELGAEAVLSVASNGGSLPWYSFTQNAIDAVNFFTSQDYGPHKVKFTYDSFVEMYNNYMDYGLPKNKIMHSFGAYAVGEYQQYDSTPYRGFAKDVPDADTDQIPRDANSVYNFTGINQVKKRTQFVLDNDVCGLMYYDIVCDVLPSDPKSLTRSMAQALASNNELIVEVSDPLTSIYNTERDKEECLQLFPSPLKCGSMLNVSGATDHKLIVYDLTGRIVATYTLADPQQTNQVDVNIAPGIYVVKSGNESTRLIVSE